MTERKHTKRNAPSAGERRLRKPAVEEVAPVAPDAPDDDLAALPELQKLEVMSDGDAAQLPPAREVKELGKRAGTPLTAASVRFIILAFGGTRHERSISEALRKHVLGTWIRLLYARKADVVLGHSSWEAFLRAELRMGHTKAGELMRFAREVTREEAQHYGDELCEAGIELKLLLKKRRIADLEGAALVVPARHGGGTVTFTKDANPALVEVALEHLRRKEEPAEDGEADPSVVRRVKTLVAEAKESNPVLEEMGLRGTVWGKQTRVAHDPAVNRAQAAALAAFYASLAKVRGF